MSDTTIKRRRLHNGGAKIDGFTVMAIPYYLVILILILLPVVMIGIYAFLSSETTSEVLIFSLENFRKFFSSSENLVALWKSLRFAVVATFFCLLLGYPFAYFLVGCSQKVRSGLLLLITAPMWINMLLRVYALRQIFDSTGAINTILNFIGLGKVDFLAYDFTAIIGMVYIYLPFMIIPIYTTLLKIDHLYIEASLDLGANPHQVFSRIILPLSIPGVLSGITMVLLPTATTLVVPQYLSKNNYALIGNLIEMYFKNAGDWGYGSAISLIMGIIIMVLVYLANRFDRLSDDKAKMPRAAVLRGGKKV